MNEKNGFLPEGYKVPKELGHYMKFKQGNNKFRILSNPIMGIEGWTMDKKPVRAKMTEKLVTKDLQPNVKIKHFWAMPVYNYAENKVQILEITQSTIQGMIKDYTDNEDWGSPLEYDLSVNRLGEQMDTEYTVIASPKKELNVMAKKMWEETKKNGFDLNKLFTNENPFENKQQQSKDNEINVEEEIKNIPF